MINLFALTLFALASIITETAGQSYGLNLALAFPRGEFAQYVKRGGFGGNVEGMLNFNGSIPMALGLNLGFYNYGNESRNAPFSHTIPDVTVNVERSNNIGHLQLLIRLQTNNTLLRPYVDILAGGAFFSTTTTIKKERNDEEVTSSTNAEDFAWSYGAGAGILWKISEMTSEGGSGTAPLYLDFKVRYLLGTRAEYLREGDVSINPSTGQITYFFSKSKTDVLTVHLGIHALFNSIGD